MKINREVFLKKLIEWAQEKKAENIRIFDVSGKTDYVDQVFFCSGAGDLHNRAIADHLIRKAKENDYELISKEGFDNASWILLDFIDVIVHIFDPETRVHYNIEEILTIINKKKETNDKE